jgi:hypothetical protein
MTFPLDKTTAPLYLRILLGKDKKLGSSAPQLTETRILCIICHGVHKVDLRLENVVS